MWISFVKLLDQYRIGDITGITGMIITIFGFIFTIVNVMRSKKAAELAEAAAKSTQNSIRFIDSIVDFTEAILTLEEIKRIHRQKAWNTLPDRCATVRKVLIKIRSLIPDLTDADRDSITLAIINLSSLERLADKVMNDGNELISTSKINSKIIDDVDRLVELLNALKKTNSGP